MKGYKLEFGRMALFKSSTMTYILVLEVGAIKTICR